MRRASGAGPPDGTAGSWQDTSGMVSRGAGGGGGIGSMEGGMIDPESRLYGAGTGSAGSNVKRVRGRMLQFWETITFCRECFRLSRSEIWR